MITIYGCSTNGASPQPDEPWGGWAWLIGLRSATDGDTLCPVMGRLWRWLAFWAESSDRSLS
jgi:hypothetical protein